MRDTASVVSVVNPIEAVSWNCDMSISFTPGGADGWISTGKAASSMAFQIGANCGSVRCWPDTFANTITPQAPALRARSNSFSAACGYCQGSDAKNWMR